MQQVTIHAAKAKLSMLIDAALRGEDVVIVKGGKPVIRLVPVDRGKFQIGQLTGQLGEGPDFFEPMSDGNLALWEGQV